MLNIISQDYIKLAICGRVKSLPRNGTIKEERILTPRITTNGYLYVHLRSGNISKYVKIHRLVAETFIPNIDNKPCVNHIDGNKQNNKVNNLEWATLSENTKHAIENGLYKIIRDGKGRFMKRTDTQ